MATFSKVSCPKCKTTLENWQHSYIAFGNPLITCPNCKAVVRLSHINEWDSMPIYKRAEYILIFGFQAIAFPAFWVFMGGYILGNILGTETFFIGDNPTTTTIALAILVALIFLVQNTTLFMQKVTESKKRTKNPEYRRQLGI